jgi:outer membrane lipase/esterase
MKKKIPLSLLLWTLLIACIQARPYTAIYVVGDSLSDSGNNPPTDIRYWNGRTSNGPMWPELLSDQFGIPYSQPNNKAFSSAASYDQPGIPGIATQIRSLPIKSPATALFVIWIGTNDVQQSAPRYYDIAYTTTVDRTFLRNVSNAIRILYRKGARRVVVLNIYDITNTPLWRNGPFAAALPAIEDRLNSLNAQLSARLNYLKPTVPRLRIIKLDVKTGLSTMFTSPQNYDIAFPYGIGYDDPNFLLTRDWSIGENYCTWDGLHPTSKLHRALATWIYLASQS